MSNDRKINLKELFKGLQSQMTATLNTSRSFITHSGSKGDALENAWIEWLQDYLPNRYSIAKAIVIDSSGNTSHQLDIVIYDNWFTPFIFNQNGLKFIPAEGVYAVFEVKPNLSKEHIEYAGAKVESVRKLKRTSTKMINSGKVFPPRDLTKIIGGLLCSTTDIKGESTISNHLSNLKGFKSLDMICVADFGSIMVEYTGTIEDEHELPYDKYYDKRELNRIVLSKPGHSLVSFFLQLSHLLQQRIGTIPAIDFQAYMDGMGEELGDIPEMNSCDS